MKKTLTLLLMMILATQAVTAQVDMHCHMIPASYLEAVKAHGMEMDEGFPLPSWDASAHLAFMDEAGIRTSVLTMPAPQPYLGDEALDPLMAKLSKTAIRWREFAVSPHFC